MSGVFLEVKHAVGGVVSAVVAGAGVVMASITSDALVPIVMGAGGIAGAIIFWWNAPKDAAARRQIDMMTRDLEYAEKRIAELEKMQDLDREAHRKELEQECEAHRQTRRLLAQCYDRITRAGVVIVTPDPDREPPKPPA